MLSYSHTKSIQALLLRTLFILLSSFCSVVLLAQSNSFTGTWQLDVPTGNKEFAGLQASLQISAGENGLLFPSELSIKANGFAAVYDLLLVKKSSRELAISRNKQVITETPFALDAAMFYLNGAFVLGKDMKGNSTLSIERIQSKQISAYAKDASLTKEQQALLNSLQQFLKDGDIKFVKQNTSPWSGDNTDHMLSNIASPVYFGLTDTVYLNGRDGHLEISGPKKNDLVSLAVNGRNIIYQLPTTRKAHAEDLLLDTGLNLIAFFAENFADDIPNKGRLNLNFGDKNTVLDFTNKGDSGASFIIARLYCGRDKSKDNLFKEYVPPANTKPLQNNEKLLGSIVATTQTIQLGVWDDAVEDGDSISISINNKWLVQGLPVKKQPQFITVTLQPGNNAITFVANNLGTIPPNTSILELYDGKRRKSFSLETVLGENNLIRIFYDTAAQ